VLDERRSFSAPRLSRAATLVAAPGRLEDDLVEAGAGLVVLALFVPHAQRNVRMALPPADVDPLNLEHHGPQRATAVVHHPAVATPHHDVVVTLVESHLGTNAVEAVLLGLANALSVRRLADKP